MYSIQVLREKKKLLGLSNKQIAELSGVPLGTVQKIFSGETETPRYKTLLEIDKAIAEFAKETSVNSFREGEAAYAVHPQHKYTVEDYLALPDNQGQRYELIDGVLYDMGAPTISHQYIAGFINRKLFSFKEANPRPCIPLVSPVDVQLDMDDYTMVQPDVLILCDKKKITEGFKRIMGAPEFIAEVVSPSSYKKDTSLKLRKYMKAGVKEYWIIIPEDELVLVYFFDSKGKKKSGAKRSKENESGNMARVYTFEDKVPVGLWGNECLIDFSQLAAELAEMI